MVCFSYCLEMYLLYFRIILTIYNIHDLIINYNVIFIVDMLRFVKSKKGTKILLIAGHRYYKVCVYKCKERWRCTKHQSQRCKAAVTILDNTVIYFRNPHNHPPDFSNSK